MYSSVLCIVLLFVWQADAESDVSKNVLVLIENNWVVDTHAVLLNWLSENGYSTTLKVADDPKLELTKYGEYLYRHIFILAPSVSEFGGALNVKELAKFTDEGGNLLVAASSDVGEGIRQLGVEYGIEFDEENTSVIDHSNYDIKDDGSHTLLVVPPENIIPTSCISGGGNYTPLLYKGIGISADSANPLLIDVLQAARTSYSYSPLNSVTEYPNTVGTNTKLIAALQARNNARALFTGSLDFLSDAFFTSPVEHSLNGEKHSVSGNRKLVENLLRWVLCERGQLRVASVEHHRVGERVAPTQYTIMDEVEFSITVETKDTSGAWVPYQTDDLQLEFVRIDPFIRRTLKFKDGKYSTVLKLPDVYGVFKFVVDYYRQGYTHITSISTVPVRPFTHTQYERFIQSAYPYYGSAISVMIGTLLFSFLFLYHRDEVKDKHE